MDEASNKMSKVSRIGLNQSRSFPYYLPPENSSKKQEAYKIRAGEILKGNVQSVDINSYAEVRLPNGTYRCELHNRLMKNDELYFKVASITPSLVLKVHSISSKINGIVTDTEKILRILDLDEAGIFAKLIDFLKARKSIIIRDEVLLIMQNYENLTSQNKSFKSINEIFRTLFWLNESKISGNNNNFKNYFPLFQDGDFVKKILINIYKDLKFTEESEDYKKLLRTINLNSETEYLLRYFSKSSPLYIWLDKLISNSKSPKSGIQLWNILQSMHLWNETAYQEGNSFQFFFPIPFGKSFITAKMILSNYLPEDSRAKGKNSKIMTDPAGILSQAYSMSNFKLPESNSYSELEANLIALAEHLKISAKYNNISIQALILQEENGNEKDILPSRYVSTTRNFSIVV